MTKKNPRKKKQPKKSAPTKNNTAGDNGMYQSISIENFKCFKRIDLKNLGLINIFFGPNNSGKTSVLEAVFAHAAGANIYAFDGQVFNKRKNNITSGLYDYGENIFNMFNVFNNPVDGKYQFKISAKLENNTKKQILLNTFTPDYVLYDLKTELSKNIVGPAPEQKFIPGPNYPGQPLSHPGIVPPQKIGAWEIKVNDKTDRYDAYFPPNYGNVNRNPLKMVYVTDILSHRDTISEVKIYGQLKRSNLIGEFTSELTKYFQEIREIDLIPRPDGIASSVYIGLDNEKKLPLSSFGDGLRRWFHVLGNFVLYKNAIHCIEEIDATFHPEVQAPFAKRLYHYSKEFKNQIFATSHSIEFVDSFLKSLFGPNGAITDSDEDPIRIFTLDRSTDDIGIWALSGREAYDQRTQYNIDLRK